MDKATVSCHNCRRRRIVCDQSLPHCQRCFQSGQQCLGYGVLYKWNQGIASRGKMRGKTFGQQEDIAAQAQAHQPTVPLANPTTHLPTNAPRRQASFPFDGAVNPLPSADTVLNPGLEYLDEGGHFYLRHFGNTVSRALVLYGSPIENPYESILPYGAQNGALTYLMVAIAAFCLSQERARAGGSRRSYILSTDRDAQWHPGDPMKDHLEFKQKSLALTLESLQTRLAHATNDIPFLCAILFMELELLGSDSHEGRIHIEAARKMLSSTALSPDTRFLAMKIFRCSSVFDTLLYDMLGSALVPNLASSSLVEPLWALIESVSADQILSCPADLLKPVLDLPRVLHEGIEDASSRTHAARCIQTQINKITSYNPEQWIASFSHQPGCKECPKDQGTRVHVVEAYRAAICILIVRLASFFSIADLSVGDYYPHLIHHLTCLRQHDPLTKATSWPTFIACLESGDSDMARRMFDRFVFIRESLPWGYLRTAVEVLRNVREEGSGFMGTLNTFQWPALLASKLSENPIISIHNTVKIRPS